MSQSTQTNKRAAPSDQPGEENQRSAKIARFDFTNTVKIIKYEQDQATEFLVPKNLITRRSKLFAQREKDGLIDVPYMIGTLPANSVSRYLQLLYTGKVVLFCEEETAVPTIKWSAILAFMELSRLFEGVESKNMILNEIIRMLHDGVPCRRLLIWLSCPKLDAGLYDTLRQILVDFAVEKFEAGRFLPDWGMDKTDESILHDAITEFAKRKSGRAKQFTQNTVDGMKKYHFALE